ncbi:type II toxin-antitoxin system RelE/ParE family toxin [Enterovirga rhinocerotis]|uniref:Plasmid stabilization system protein ParE n=1 Tax=Enterovirga rhinocerotis TaxID=1339210 RepID=A0A4R7C930_9HYPH|nr:type II toxin-antitoxin system RelE/ParE family toxin [Enterovirga rhinocerotis]TDR94948.1 plasmid stabilization system protein ParE [Enterovirga rhinocerotis]
MRPREVRFSQNALNDLADILAYISLEASPAIAERYIGRLVAACERVGLSGEAGRPRDDLRHGLRTWPVERRAVITYTIEDDEIIIARIFRRGRSIESYYQSEEPLLP